MELPDGAKPAHQQKNSQKSLLVFSARKESFKSLEKRPAKLIHPNLLSCRHFEGFNILGQDAKIGILVFIDNLLGRVYW